MTELTYWAMPVYLLDDWDEKSPEIWGRLCMACLTYAKTGDRRAAGRGLFPGDMDAFRNQCREIDRARAAVEYGNAHEEDISNKRKAAARTRWMRERAATMQMHANASKKNTETNKNTPPYIPPRGESPRSGGSPAIAPQYTNEEIEKLEIDLNAERGNAGKWPLKGDAAGADGRPGGERGGKERGK